MQGTAFKAALKATRRKYHEHTYAELVTYSRGRLKTLFCPHWWMDHWGIPGETWFLGRVKGEKRVRYRKSLALLNQWLEDLP